MEFDSIPPPSLQSHLNITAWGGSYMSLGLEKLSHSKTLRITSGSIGRNLLWRAYAQLTVTQTGTFQRAWSYQK